MFFAENDSFDVDVGKGNRLFCVLIPASRKQEFYASPLGQGMQFCTDKIIFYSDIDQPTD